MRFWVGWQQVGISFLMVGVGNGVVFSSYGVIATPIGREYHSSHTILMLGIGAMSALGAAISPLVGSWVDRYSLRLLMTTGVVSLGLGVLALSFVQAMWQVVAIFAAFMTIPVTICGPMGVSVLVMRWFVRKRGIALGIAIAGASLGGFIFPPLIQSLIDAFEWREGLRILAGFILVAVAPAIFFLVVNRPSDRNLFADGAAAPPEGGAHVKGSKAESARRILANPNFWFVALSLGIPMSAGAGVTSNIVPFAADIGVATAEAALVLSTIAAMSLIGKLTFSVLGDRVDLRWIQAGSLIMEVLGLVTLACAHAPPLIFAGCALLSYGLGILAPLWGALIARVFGQEVAGRVMGFAMLVAMVLSMIAPVLIGAMRDASGTYVTAFLLYAALIGLAVLLLAKIRVAPKPPPASVVGT